MAKKLILYGLGNSKKFNFYIFDKKQEVVWGLVRIFNDVFSLVWDLYEEDSKSGKTKEINVRKFKDDHDRLENSGDSSRIDVFYGDKKMFIVINCSQKLRIKFNEELFKIADLYKPKRRKNKSKLKW